MVSESLLFDELLSHGVASREQDAGGDGLCEDWARGQLGLVPIGETISGLSILVHLEIRTSATF